MGKILIVFSLEFTLVLTWWALSVFHDGRGIPLYAALGLGVSNILLGFFLTYCKEISVISCMIGVVLFLIFSFLLVVILFQDLSFFPSEALIFYVLAIFLPITIPGAFREILAQSRN